MSRSPRFIGEIKAGRDPRDLPNRPKKVNTEIRNVSQLLDAYWERCVKPAGLRSEATVRSQIGVLKTHLGSLSLSLLEEPDDINRFKTDSEYAEDVELTSFQRVSGTVKTLCRLLADGVDIRVP